MSDTVYVVKWHSYGGFDDGTSGVEGVYGTHMAAVMDLVDEYGNVTWINRDRGFGRVTNEHGHTRDIRIYEEEVQS